MTTFTLICAICHFDKKNLKAFYLNETIKKSFASNCSFWMKTFFLSMNDTKLCIYTESWHFFKSDMLCIPCTCVCHVYIHELISMNVCKYLCINVHLYVSVCMFHACTYKLLMYVPIRIVMQTACLYVLDFNNTRVPILLWKLFKYFLTLK